MASVERYDDPMAIGRVLLLSLAALASSAAIVACGDGENGTTATAPQEEATERESEGGAPPASAQQGKQLFDSLGCGGCHTLAAADSSGTIGPDLDEALRGESPAFIRESIVDPNAEIASGYS